MKLGAVAHYPKSNPYYQGRQFKVFFVFPNYALFRLAIFILYHNQAPHS